MKKYLHAFHGAMHLAYFAAVFIEGHGLYAMFAGSLLIAGLFQALTGDI